MKMEEILNKCPVCGSNLEYYKIKINEKPT
nr:MAG TPA: hypothetical protein [Caudoviricetes sp.]